MKKTLFSIFMMLLANLSVFANGITSADLPSVSYLVYINDAMVTAGSQVTLSINMKNASYVTLWQTDIFLPEGISPATDASGNVVAKLSTVRTTTAKHTLETNILSNGAVRLFSASQTLKNFSGFEGEVATITLNIDKDLQPGTYAITFKNTLIAEKDQTNYKPEPYQACITVTSPAAMKGDVNNDGSISTLDLVSLISYLNGSTLPDFNESAADLDSNGIINRDDVTLLVDMLLEK